MELYDKSLELNKLTKYLIQEKNLNVINNNIKDIKTQNTIKVKDSEREYSLKILSVNDGSDNVCPNKLESAKNESKMYQECSHPNIIKFCDSFLFRTSYCILLENFYTTLGDLLNSQKTLNYLNRSYYLNTALQILEAVEYLHSKNYVLKNVQLKNIKIGIDLKIKFMDFGLCSQYNPFKQQGMLEALNRKQFILPDILDMIESTTNKDQLIYQKPDDDVWFIGMILYSLAGAIKEDILAITKGEADYISQSLVEEDINFILQNSLKRNPQERMKCSTMIQSFTQLKQIESDDSIKQQQEEICIYKQALIDVFNQDFRKSINQFLILIEKFPQNQNDRCFSSLGFQYFMIDDLEQSIVWNEKALSINKNNWSTLFYLGKVYLKLKILKQSKIYLKKAQQVCKYKNHDILLLLSEVYFLQKKYNKTLMIYSDNIDHHPSYLKLLKSNGNELLIKQNQIEMAINYYEKYLEVKKDDISILLNIGSSYDDLRQFIKAKQYYDQILAIDPNNWEAMNNLGVSYFYLKNYDKSLEFLKKAYGIYPDDCDTLRNIGVVYKCQNNFDESIKYHKMALEINPKFVDSLCNIGIVYFNNLNQYDNAIFYFRKVLNINPNHIQTLDYLSEIYLKLENNHMVQLLSKKCIKQSPQVNFGFFQFLKAKNNLSKYEDAILFYKKGINSSPYYDQNYNINLFKKKI